MKRFGALGRRGEAPPPRHAAAQLEADARLSDGHVIVRHPDWDEAHRMAFAAATDVTLYAN